MSKVAPVRTLPMIATEINSIKDQTRKLILCNSIEIGRRLLEAKAMLQHGEWGNWLKESVDYSQSTANNLMRVFEEYGSQQIAMFGDNSKSQALGNLSYTQAVALLGVPEESREQFIADHDLEEMSTRELQETIKQLKEAQEQAEKAEERAGQESDRAKTLAEELEESKKKTAESEKSLTNYKKEMEKLAKQLKKLKVADGDSKKIKELEEALKKAEEQVDDLTEKMQEPVTIEPAIVEKIPEEIKKELDELRRKVEEQENIPAKETAALKYGVCFEAVVIGFNNLLAALTDIQDDGTKEKYKQAALGLMNKMADRLKEGNLP